MRIGQLTIGFWLVAATWIFGSPHPDQQYVVTSDSFGTVGDGETDDTKAVQAFVDHVVRNQLKGYLVGKLRVTDTIKIRSHNQYAAQRFELHMIGGAVTTPFPVGSCLDWGGEDDGSPIVEINEVQRSVISLTVTNDPRTTPSINGVRWRNRTDEVIASNLNRVSVYVHGCQVGLQLGDFAGDGYHSNIDDNYYPAFHAINTRHPLLIDSHAQDNNVFQDVHFGAAKLWPKGSREYLIRAMHNGNGFRIESGFMRTDQMKTDAIAIDIQKGSFSAGRLSFEGNQQQVMLLRLGHAYARDVSVISNFTVSDHDFCDSRGVCVESRAFQGAVFIGATFGGDVRHNTPVELIGCRFREGFGLRSLNPRPNRSLPKSEKVP